MFFGPSVGTAGSGAFVGAAATLAAGAGFALAEALCGAGDGGASHAVTAAATSSVTMAFFMDDPPGRVRRRLHRTCRAVDRMRERITTRASESRSACVRLRNESRAR